MKCPKCGGENVIKMGKVYRKGKILQRYYCKDCMDYFTVEIQAKEPTKPQISNEKPRVTKENPQSVKSNSPFNIKEKQLVVIHTNRYYNKEPKEIISVTGDALDIPEVKSYVEKLFHWDDIYEDYVRSYTETSYNKILKELYAMAKKYKFWVTKM